MSEEEFDELLNLMSENNLTQHGADTLYGEIVDREIERKRLNKLNQEIANELQGVQRWLNENHKYHGYSGYYPDLSIAISKLKKEVIIND